MADFRSFDSFSEMQDYIRRSEEEANDSLMIEQISLRDDIAELRYWFRPPTGASNRLWIFGEAWSARESLDSSLDSGCTVLEAREEVESLLESRRRGYLFGRAYSILEPDGELGSTHVSNVLPMSDALWEVARRARWDLHRSSTLSAALHAAIIIACERAGRGPS